MVLSNLNKEFRIFCLCWCYHQQIVLQEFIKKLIGDNTHEGSIED
jgi:hypothetical protein